MTITNNIHTIQHQIRQTTQRYQRSYDDVCLIAVSKGQPAQAIEAAFHAGIVNIGESYWQEACQKMPLLKSYPICWHFIGPLQSNKAAAIAQHFAWVHSVCREKIARILSQHRPPHLPALNICIQVNLDNEASKAGLLAHDVLDFVQSVNQLPHLKVRGLMALPAPCSSDDAQYDSLLRLNHLLATVNQSLTTPLDTLSMGMSDDLTAAIRAGSTMVRIGRAIFGERL